MKYHLVSGARHHVPPTVAPWTRPQPVGWRRRPMARTPLDRAGRPGAVTRRQIQRPRVPPGSRPAQNTIVVTRGSVSAAGRAAATAVVVRSGCAGPGPADAGRDG